MIFAALLAVYNPAPGASSAIVYLLGGALVGGGVPAAIGAYRRWHRGPIEDEKIVTEIVASQMSGMKDLLAEYRLEVELTKRQLEDYRRELSEVTRELAKAQVKIDRLERELNRAEGTREDLRRELDTLIAERDRLVAERTRLEKEADDLRDRVSRLEDFARRVHPGQMVPRPQIDDPPPD